MGKEVLPIPKDVCQQAALVLGQAFRDDPVTMAIFDGLAPETRVKRLTIAFAEILKACEHKGMLLHVREKDRVTGVAVIHPPKVYPLPIPLQLGMLLKIVTRTGFYGLGRWLKWSSSIERRHPKEPHYYLQFLGVEPALQGNGLGSCLLHHLVCKADKEQVGCFLETANPRNIPLYGRFGFQTVAKEEIIGVQTWFMWRPQA
ncbi:MAG: GNAT family N-acetyltransferase [bacterium]